jgi:hypothetical protein
MFRDYALEFAFSALVDRSVGDSKRWLFESSPIGSDTAKLSAGVVFFAPTNSPTRQFKGRKRVMDQMCASWNQTLLWLRQIERLRRAA